MPANKKLLILPGDGIGPEVVREVRRVIDWMGRRRMVSFDISDDLVGGAAIDARGTPITDETIEKAKDADAILFGSVGGPKWEKLGFQLRPELAILRLRKELDLFANLRPAIVLGPLVDASTLKPDVVRGLDLMIVRESTGGIYFGEPRGVETLPNGERRGFDTESYTTSEIERVARVAFELARKRRNHVTSVEKANVMQSGLFWRETITTLHQRDYADVTLDHMYADNCAMQLVRNPRQFDVIVTSNIFGDLLSDLASMLTGSLGMLPSATLGPADASGKRLALYEPIHGSRHRRQGDRQPDGADLQLRHAAAVFVRHGGGRGADRACLHKCAGVRVAHGRHHGAWDGEGGHQRDGRVDPARTRQACGLTT
jgi:3-isopropylmalate dehydrogenase